MVDADVTLFYPFHLITGILLEYTHSVLHMIRFPDGLFKKVIAFLGKLAIIPRFILHESFSV